MCMWPFDMLSLFNKQKLSNSQNTYDSRDERNMEDITTCFLFGFLDMILLPLRACTAQIVHTVTWIAEACPIGISINPNNNNKLSVHYKFSPSPPFSFPCHLIVHEFIDSSWAERANTHRETQNTVAITACCIKSPSHLILITMFSNIN